MIDATKSGTDVAELFVPSLRGTFFQMPFVRTAMGERALNSATHRLLSGLLMRQAVPFWFVSLNCTINV